jgi:hypothetical protein
MNWAVTQSVSKSYIRCRFDGFVFQSFYCTKSNCKWRMLNDSLIFWNNDTSHLPLSVNAGQFLMRSVKDLTTFCIHLPSVNQLLMSICSYMEFSWVVIIYQSHSLEHHNWHFLMTHNKNINNAILLLTRILDRQQVGFICQTQKFKQQGISQVEYLYA